MSNEREELLKVMLDADEAHAPEGSMWPELADAILAAGYRKPRTITTAEELDALPIGSILLDRTGDTARKFPGGWRTTVVEPDGSAWLSGHMEDADMPATVIYEGSQP